MPEVVDMPLAQQRAPAVVLAQEFAEELRRVQVSLAEAANSEDADRMESLLDGIGLIELQAFKSGDWRTTQELRALKDDLARDALRHYGARVPRDSLFSATWHRASTGVSALISQLLPSPTPAQQARLLEAQGDDPRPIKVRVLELLRRSNRPLSNTEIATALNVHPVTIARLMPLLRHQGDVKSHKIGTTIYNEAVKEPVLKNRYPIEPKFDGILSDGEKTPAIVSTKVHLTRPDEPIIHELKEPINPKCKSELSESGTLRASSSTHIAASLKTGILYHV